MDKSTEIMRLEDVILNGKTPLGKKSKVALRTANKAGVIGRNDCISGLLYSSQNKKESEEITYDQYIKLGSPDYISRINDGTLKAVPLCLIPGDFSVREFD